MVSTSYPADNTDWRGRFIYDLVAAMAKRQDLELSFWGPPGPLPVAVRYVATGREARWLERLSVAGGVAKAIRSGLPTAAATSATLLWSLRQVYRRHRHSVDLVHVNWLQNALPLYAIPLPLVATALGSDYALLQRPGVARLLRRTIAQRPSVLVPNAAWMAPGLAERFGSAAAIQTIPFGVDERWFEVERRGDAQSRNGAKKRWLVVSRLTEKKLGPLFSWCQSVMQNDHELHLFGPMQEPVAIPDWVHYHGATHPDELRSRWFPQAAGLITTSRHDEGRPQIILEAMAAGLPVIASAISGHEDMIINGQTGYLVKSKNELNAVLKRLGESQCPERIGAQARHWVKESVGTWRDCADRFNQLYSELLNGGKTAGAGKH